MSKIVTSGYASSAGLGTAVFVRVLNPIDGSVLVARTNGGVREDVASSGFYTWSGTVATLESYELIWDENGTVFAGDIVIPEPDVTVTVIEGTPLPITGDANGSIQGTAFLIKRNDTYPYLTRQLVDTNGNAVTLGSADTVMFTMRSSTDVAMSGTAKVHSAAVITDAASGIVQYRWATGDTNTTTYSEANLLGQVTNTPYAGEFEVTRASDGKIETFPQGGYIAITIPPDLDPGVEP